VGRKTANLSVAMTVVSGLDTLLCSTCLDFLKDSGGGTIARDFRAGPARAVSNKTRVKQFFFIGAHSTPANAICLKKTRFC
jgi:hypothetical protein